MQTLIAGLVFTVVASWYGPGFEGRPTASGAIFNSSELTAAHKTLPFGTRLRVTGPNGKTVIVTITDRGPYRKGRTLDLSRFAAHYIGMRHCGVAKVQVRRLHD